MPNVLSGDVRMTQRGDRRRRPTHRAVPHQRRKVFDGSPGGRIELYVLAELADRRLQGRDLRGEFAGRRPVAVVLDAQRLGLLRELVDFRLTRRPGAQPTKPISIGTVRTARTSRTAGTPYNRQPPDGAPSSGSRLGRCISGIA